MDVGGGTRATGAVCVSAGPGAPPIGTATAVNAKIPSSEASVSPAWRGGWKSTSRSMRCRKAWRDSKIPSQMGNNTTQTNPRDVLVDESKQADIENLGDCLRVLGDGQSLGDFSLTIVLYAATKSETDQVIGEFTSVFTNADGNLFIETYNQLNAYFATVPGNYAQNLRKLYLLNTNYADL